MMNKKIDQIRNTDSRSAYKNYWTRKEGVQCYLKSSRTSDSLRRYYSVTLRGQPELVISWFTRPPLVNTVLNPYYILRLLNPEILPNWYDPGPDGPGSRLGVQCWTVQHWHKYNLIFNIYFWSFGDPKITYISAEERIVRREVGMHIYVLHLVCLYYGNSIFSSRFKLTRN
mgnify:CR=1 FL=1